MAFDTSYDVIYRNLGGHPVLSGHYSTPRGYPLNTGFTVFIRSERVIETYVQRRQCFKSTKSSFCCYYILQEKEENSDIIVLIRHVFMFLYYITLMCLNDKTVPSSKIACSACFRQAAYHKMFF